jgi:hypothetical protein
LSAAVTGIDALSTINFIRACNPFLLATLADPLEFRRHYQLAVNVGVGAGGTWIGIRVLDE